MPPYQPLPSHRAPAPHRKPSLAATPARVAVALTALAAAAAIFVHHSTSAAGAGPALGRAAAAAAANTTRLSGEALLAQPFAARIIVSEKSRLVFCPVPKAASSNWKFLIRKREGLDDYADMTRAHLPASSGLRYLTDYSPREADAVIGAFFKFAFVRDPYARAVSAYMDKFLNTAPAYVRSEYRGFVADLYGWRHARALDVDAAPRPGFGEFVDELAKQRPGDMNEHWRPQALLCGFGEMPYDFVGRMDRLQDDAAYVLGRLGWRDERFPSQADIGFPPSGASDGKGDEFLTVEAMVKLRIIYEVDFNSNLGLQGVVDSGGRT